MLWSAFFVIASTPRAHAHARTRVESVLFNVLFIIRGRIPTTPWPDSDHPLAGFRPLPGRIVASTHRWRDKNDTCYTGGDR